MPPHPNMIATHFCKMPSFEFKDPRIAVHCPSKLWFVLMAAVFFPHVRDATCSLCGQHHRALKLFLQCGKQEVEAAIAVVGKARNDMLTHTLIDFLMGETDGVPKDPNYIYRLYMALGSYSQAAKTAIIIAKQEQDLGNYKVRGGAGWLNELRLRHEPLGENFCYIQLVVGALFSPQTQTKKPSLA